MLDQVIVDVVSVLAGAFPQDVLLMKFSVIEHLVLIVISILLFAQQLYWLLLAFVVCTHLAWRPEVSLPYIGQSATKFDLELRGVAVVQERRDLLVIKEVDLPYCALIKEVLHDGPQEGNGGGDSKNIAHKHSAPIGIREEGGRSLKGAFEGEEANFCNINY